MERIELSIDADGDGPDQSDGALQGYFILVNIHVSVVGRSDGVVREAAAALLLFENVSRCQCVAAFTFKS